MSGRHNKSNGRITDITAPNLQHPAPYGRATKAPQMSSDAFRAMIKKDPSHFPCGAVTRTPEPVGE